MNAATIRSNEIARIAETGRYLAAEGALSAAMSLPAHGAVTVTLLKTNAQLAAMHLSIYTLSKLADVLNCVDPQKCLEHRLSHPAFAHKGWTGALALDALGNFVSFS